MAAIGAESAKRLVRPQEACQLVWVKTPIFDCDEMWERMHGVCVREREMLTEKRVKLADMCRIMMKEMCQKMYRRIREGRC